MKKPKAVFFDFGGTLFTDGQSYTFEALDALRLKADNPDATSTNTLLKIAMDLLERIKQREKSGVDIQLTAIIKNVVNRAGLEYSTDLERLAILFDAVNSRERAALPNIEKLLNVLKNNNIKTAVISNTVMSGTQMTAAINRLLPDNDFEFVFTSGDFVFKKPCSDMFEAAAVKTGLNVDDCWYCGDSYENDVIGSSSAGMFPVYYTPKMTEPFEFIKNPDVEYLAVNDWSQLIKVITSE